jgi:hypothetical protein
MNPESEHDVNQAAYRRLKDRIRDSYPAGRFVAIAEGQIVCDADSFPHLDGELTSRGLRPGDVLVVQAGVDYPDYANILIQGCRP